MSARYSIIPLVALRDCRLSPRDITVLSALGSYTNEKGICYPSLGTIGETLGISRQAVQKSMTNLVACGYVAKKERSSTGRGQITNVYHVNMDFVPENEFMRGSESGSEQPENDPTPCNHRLHPLQPQVAPPATSEVAPPATSEVARTTPYNDQYIPPICPPSESCTDDLGQVAPDPHPPPPSPPQQQSEQRCRFQEWWTIYPKKVKKKTARDIWKRKRLNEKADDLITDVQQRLDMDCRWLDGYIPDPTTYLNQERWEDEITAPPQDIDRNSAAMVNHLNCERMFADLERRERNGEKGFSVRSGQAGRGNHEKTGPVHIGGLLGTAKGPDKR